jgi:hypothetical protein
LQKVANRAQAHQAEHLVYLDRLVWLAGLSEEEWDAREDWVALELLRA